MIAGSIVTQPSSNRRRPETGTVTSRTTGRQAPAPLIQSIRAIPASRRFNPTMTAAVVHDSTSTQVLFENDPMRERSLVK